MLKDLLKQPECEIKLLSSLEKVFEDEIPVYRPECLRLTALQNETVSFQVAFKSNAFMRSEAKLKVESALGDKVHVRQVVQVPARKVAHPIVDDNYLKTEPGLYPDLLREISQDRIILPAQKWASLWVDVDVDESVPAGSYDIRVAFERDGQTLCEATMPLQVYGAALPKLDIMHTEWFHADCLADYYGVEVFSEAHWTLIRNFFQEYVKRGCNMILTPLFTYSLDVAVGVERTTTQLVGVKVIDGGYEFDFSLLERWVELAKACGIEYFEMNHLFSQWGGKYPPKVVAGVDGRQETIFGWHTPAVGEYTTFLHALLPQLTEKLREWGIADKTYFHISDEPREQHLESFKAAKDSLGDLLKGFHTFDALSSYEFYKHGLISKPVPGNNEIDEFLDHGLTEMWTYYCTGQFFEVSNRFMAMPSLRNRIYGLQLYKYQIIGILHWGYNFYNTQYSYERVDPYAVTDAGEAFPAGDPFLVYPGPDGFPEESIRMMVHYQALCDLRACKLLEKLAGRDYVMELIEGELFEPLTFKRFPKSDMYLLGLRNRINAAIARFACADEEGEDCL